MPPTNSQKAAIEQFKAFTGANDRTASSYMKRYGYSVDVASDAYFQATGSAPPAVSQKVESNLAEMFEGFRDATDDKDSMSIEGMLSYLSQIGVDPSGADLFIPLEIVRATEFGTLNKEGFVSGWKEAGSISQVLDTISSQKAYIEKQKILMAKDKATFKRYYRSAFVSSKEKGQKALALSNAIVYWQLLFSGTAPGQPWKTPSQDWLALWVEYLEKKWTKSVNKDMWNQTFEFHLKTLEDESLSFWSEDSAWPGVIDDFVAYAKETRGTGGKMELD